MKSAISIFCLILSGMSSKALAKQIIVDEMVFQTFIYVDTVADVSEAEVNRLLSQEIQVTDSCYAKGTATIRSISGGYSFVLKATCLDAGLAFFNNLKDDTRLKITLGLPKPVIGGSN